MQTPMLVASGFWHFKNARILACGVPHTQLNLLFWHTIRRTCYKQTEPMEQFLIGNISFEEQRRRRIGDVVSHPVSHEEADRIFSDYLAAYEANWTLFPEVRDVLAALGSRGVRMGVITNGDAAQQRSKLRTLDLAQFFEHTLISGELGLAKPGREVFQTAADRMGCSTRECVHIGDSFENDVNGAIGAGMRAVWLDREGRGTPSGERAGYVRIRDLRELLDFAWLQ